MPLSWLKIITMAESRQMERTGIMAVEPASRKDLWKELPSLPGRTARIVVGTWAMVWDGVTSSLHSPATVLEQLELRGVQVKRQLSHSLRSLEEQAESTLLNLSYGALTPVRAIHARVTGTSRYAEAELEHQIEHLLDHMGIPNRERIERLNHEIDLLSSRIDEELHRREQHN